MGNKDSILVSIIIPTYSRNETLIRAINSALNQTYDNIEILVIDDNKAGSEWRIKTEKLMEQFIINPKIRYIKNKENLGGAGARNEGIKIANGEYLAFLDDDDEYYPDKVEKQLQKFIEENNLKLGLVYGFSEFVDHGKVLYRDSKQFFGNCLFDAMNEHCIATTSQWMVKKDIAQKIGGFPIVPAKQDAQFILQLLLNGYEISCVPKILSRYYWDLDALSHISSSTKSLEGELLYQSDCRKIFDRFSRKQVKSIEYRFARELYGIYSGLNEPESAKIQKRKMYSLDLKRSIVYFGKERLRTVKKNSMDK